MSVQYHEPAGELEGGVRNLHRAVGSLIEELEAVDWYHQRASLTEDVELRDVLVHNRDEEIEHAAMLLEYLRRMVPKFDESLRTYLFTSRPIAELEKEAEAAGADDGDAEAPPALRRDLGIGRNKEGA